MAQYADLKAAINAAIKQNNNQEITGSVLNSVLNAMVNSLGANYQFAGVATPSTNPGTPDQNVFYLAGQPGIYSNFNNATIEEGIYVFTWNGSTWANSIVFEGGNGGAFDVSAKYPTSGVGGGNTYTLQGAIDVLSVNLPASKKKGGMSIKFIQNTDHKYVQYRYMSSSTSVANFTNVANWQGVDNGIVAGSKNLAESGSVEKALTSVKDKFVTKGNALSPTSSDDGFYKSDLIWSGHSNAWQSAIFNITQDNKDNNAGIVISAAPRLAAYVSLTDANDNILWQTNAVSAFPEIIFFTDFPTLAKIYISNEVSALANYSVYLCNTALDELPKIESDINKQTKIVTEKKTLSWAKDHAYINENGGTTSLSTFDYIIYDLSNVCQLNITIVSGVAGYIFIDNETGNHLYSDNNCNYVNKIIDLCDYPGAKILKVCSRNTVEHSVIAYEVRQHKPVVIDNLVARRGSFDSGHVISLPSIFENFPLSVKISYYEGCIGCNLSALNFTKNNANSNTYFVSPNGNDALAGNLPNTAFATIEQALSQEQVNTIVLLDGIYNAGVNFTAGLQINKEINIIGVGDVVIKNVGNPIELTAPVFVSNITFKGGNSCLKATLTDDVCAFYRCKFMESDTQNGLSILGGTCILEECEASHNLRDGFNYHRNTVESVNYAPKAVEINCVGYFNGERDDSNINNGSTIHDGGMIFRILCSYGYSRGCSVADVANCKSYNIGVVSYSTIERGADNTKKSNFGLQVAGSNPLNTVMYLVGCTSFGSRYDVYAIKGSNIYRTAAFPKETGDGNYYIYTPSYI